MKKKLTEEEIISRIEDLNADPAELPRIIIRKEGDGYRCATGVPKVPLIRRSYGEGFVTTPVTAYGDTEADAYGRLAQLMVQRLKLMCELLIDSGMNENTLAEADIERSRELRDRLAKKYGNH